MTRIDRLEGAWMLRTTAADIRARQVVVATGQQDAPRAPEWPGAEGFAGEMRPQPVRQTVAADSE